jgi:uncharacterized protein YbaP (TraB family)
VKYSLPFLVLFLFFFETNAQVSKKSLLWEIKNKEGKTCSFLFGTIHAIDETKFYFPKKLEKTLSKSDAICLEIKNVATDAPSMDKLMLQDKSLNELFNKVQLDSIYKWADKFLYLKPQQFDENFGNVKPFVLLQFILQSSLPEKTLSYEQLFEDFALDNKKQLFGLETADFQLGLFDKMSFEQQVQLVMESLKDVGNAKLKFEELEAKYLSQDLDALFKYVKEESKLDNRDLLENRNLNWIPLMETMMENKVVFFAFGAAHLAGPEGVIELLINKGYQVTPIKL